MPKKKKPSKKRNPVAKQASKMPTKVVPNKKKEYPVPGDQPSTRNYNYNSQGIFGGSDY